MCGIAGIYLREQAVTGASLDRLARRMSHRGPDKLQAYSNGSLGFVHARLSVIDLVGGNQPIFASLGNLALICNGEIYNHVELRQELESKGARFATDSDCEVILQAYLHYGEHFLEKLNGMFAFALYDHAERKLLLIRDRLGIKPLFFFETPDGIYFASEQKALFPLLPNGIQIDFPALIQVLETGFNTGRSALVTGIQRVMPGEMVVFRKGALVSRRRYWTSLQVVAARSTLDEATAQFEALMEQVMKEHVRSDVPFALFLSGGLDSSIVLEWLRRKGVQPLHAFTAFFEDSPNHDDLWAAQTIAQNFGLQHIVVNFNRASLLQHLPFAVWATDDMIIDQAILPTSLLAQQVSRQFKVVFSGEGGDELFAGYGRYRRLGILRWLAQWRSPGSGGFRTRGFLKPIWRRTLLSENLRPHLKTGRRGFMDAWQATPNDWSDLQRMQYTDLTTELVDQLLVKVDRTLMAWGVEGRVPLLDHRVVEFALSLPDTLKVQGREGKHFLKSWAEPIYGRDLVRRKKRGFSVPVEKCLRGETLRRLLQVLPGHPAFEGLFNAAGIENLIRRHEANGDAGKPLWSLLQFAVWYQVFVVNQGAKPELYADPIEFIA